ncbi:ABC-2 type transport system ATP-binding protein [Alkalibacterium putridalgicola]|uniref:ABC transporter n=1 Tax=Alkalibacterium putridalgicola TaxID=426703 RepID=A0A1H7W1I6_9LACT|nr:ABC transporter ATP-binding protein [Alkalibacterium putridalgicola]GEK88676.1 ABC transporter [Alkalibacterium putridalgicola]SEM14867.1 ABC-2 type transport system ATP-binding protein [Alkalibacterium putridalgicola]
MKPIVELVDVTKQFDGTPVLKGVTFSVMPGEIIGYIGPNGAGKSTTVKIILGMLKKDAGTIRLFDQPLDPNDVTYKARIGYVPENAELYETLTAKEYLLFVGELYGMEEKEIVERAVQMMDALGIKDAFHGRLSSFSKGMRQKVLIISSLIHDPDILFWDEPLSGLDANSVQIIKELLAKLKQEGKTIFYSSHVMDTVEKLSDRILILHDGHVVADGPFSELKKEAAGTLEQLFNTLTGFDQHEALAEQFLKGMKGEITHDA